MLVSKNIKKMSESGPASIGVGDGVRVVSLDQIGTVQGYRDGKVLVQLTEGSTIPCDRGDLEKRQILTEAVA